MDTSTSAARRHGNHLFRIGMWKDACFTRAATYLKIKKFRTRNEGLPGAGLSPPSSVSRIESPDMGTMSANQTTLVSSREARPVARFEQCEAHVPCTRMCALATSSMQWTDM